MKLFITALFSAFCTLVSITPAQALESTHLSSHGSFELFLEIYDSGALACSIRSENNRGMDLDITVSNDRGIDFWIFTHQPLQKDDNGTIIVWVNETEWTLDSVKFLGDPSGSILFQFPDHPSSEETNKAFLNDLAMGYDLKLQSRSGNHPTWSLFGSASALKALNDCWNKIQPAF